MNKSKWEAEFDEKYSCPDKELCKEFCHCGIDSIKSFIRQAIEEAVKERDEYWHDVLREQREASEDRS